MFTPLPRACNRRTVRPRILLASIASLLTAHTALAADAVLTSGAFTGDADSGVSTSKTYTAIANVIGGNVTVNGEDFLGSGGAVSGAGWDLTGVPNQFPTGFGGNHTTTFGASVIDDLFDGFQYGGNPGVVTMSGLTAGQTYVATLYNQAWVLGDNRTQIITSSEGASLIYNEDALEASVVRYTFVATGATTALNFAINNPTAASMHLYGLSNGLVFDNTWTPASGNSWHTPANWSSGAVPNSVGSNASFSAQAGPTEVTLAGATTVGHVQFLGTGSYSVAAVDPLTLQADAGGVSVLSAEAGGSHTISAPAVLQSDLSKFGAGTITLAGGVSGSKNVSVSSGTLQLGAANSYTGSTTVAGGGTLRLAGGALPSTTALNLAGSGALFDMNGGATSMGSLAGVAGSGVTTGGGALTVGGSSSSRFSGDITGGGSLTKVGTGTLSLLGTVGTTGGTTVSAGTLHTEQAITGGTMDVAAGATWYLAAANHTVNGLTGNGNVTRSGVVSTGADGAALISASKNYVQKLDFGNNAGATVNGVTFNNAGTSGTDFTLTGAGVEFGGGDTGGYDQLVGDFYYDGNPGVLTFSSLTIGQTYQAVLYTKIGHWAGRPQNFVFDEDGAGAFSTTLNGSDPGNFGYYAYDFMAQTSSMSISTHIAGSGSFHWFGASLESVGATASATQKTLTVGDSGSYGFGGTITGPTKLIKQGSGGQALYSASNYSGGTDITGGSIFAYNPAALGTGAISVGNNANYAAWWNTGSPVIANNFTLNGMGGNPGDGNKDAIYADGGGGGHGEYILTGSVTLAATSNIGGHNTNNLRVNGQITGLGGLTKGAGRGDENNTLTLANTSNDYEGNTNVTAGTMKLAASEVIPHGEGKGTVAVAAGATLDLAGHNETINNLSGAGTVTSSPGVAIAAPVTFNNDAGTGISNTKTYTHALDFADGPDIAINDVNFTAAGTSGATWNLAGAPGVAGNGATAATGDISRLLTNFYYGGNPATLTLSGLTPGTSYETHLYQRQWGGDRTQLFNFSSGSASNSVFFDSDASGSASYMSFRYTADASGTATLSTTQIGTGTYHWYGLSNEVVAAPAAPVLTVGDASNSIFSGSLTGPLALAKTGGGMLELSGSNSNTGATTVSGGTLLITGTMLSTASVAVNAGILGGSGSINPAASIAVASGAAIAPGASIGTLSTGPVAFADGSAFTIEIGATTADQLLIAGAGSLSGTITLSLALLADPVDNTTFTLIDATDDLTGYLGGARFSYSGNNLDEGEVFTATDGPITQDFQISYNADTGNDVILLAVPEPGSATLLLLGLGAFAGRRRPRLAGR